MNIAPNSELRILAGIKLDKNYQNTLDWSSLAAQESFFKSQSILYFADDLAYIRYSDGVLRFNANIRAFCNANYIMFKNTNFENKYFYAFVDEVKYINNTTTELHFTLDIFQTWFAIPNINQTFVEREHVANDGVGNHTVDEGLPTGDPYYFNALPFVAASESDTDISKLCVVIETTFVPMGDGDFSPPFTVLGRVIRGTRFTAFVDSQLQDFAEVMAWINNRGLGDGVVGLFLFPQGLLSLTEVSRDLEFTDSTTKTVKYSVISSVKQSLDAKVEYSARITGYSPRNNKLLCYPFCFAYFSNNSGKNIPLLYDYDRNGTKTFRCFYTAQLGGGGTLMATLQPADSAEYVKTLPLGGFPQVGYAYDKYLDYMALNQNKLALQQKQLVVNGAINAVSQGISGGAGGGFLFAGVPGAIAGATVGAGKAVWETVQSFSKISAEQADIDLQPNGLIGQSQTPDTLVLNGRYRAFLYQVCPRPEYARIIDDYFDAYGYKVCEVKKPSIATRKNWNYIKTVGATVGTEMPAEDRRKICAVLDAGITFWHNPTTMLDYSQDNSQK